MRMRPAAYRTRSRWSSGGRGRSHGRSGGDVTLGRKKPPPSPRQPRCRRWGKPAPLEVELELPRKNPADSIRSEQGPSTAAHRKECPSWVQAPAQRRRGQARRWPRPWTSESRGHPPGRLSTERGGGASPGGGATRSARGRGEAGGDLSVEC